MNDLEKYNDAQVPATISNPLEASGLDNLGTVRPGQLILVSEKTKNKFGALPGQFLDTGSKVAYDSLDVVALQIFKPRVLYPEGAEFGAKPMCRSNDGLVPAPGVEVPQAKRCVDPMTGKALCPHAQFRKLPNGKWKPGPCREKRKFLLIGRDGDLSGLARWLTLGGMSIPALKPGIQILKENVQRDYMLYTRGKRERPSALHDFSFTFKVDKVPSSYGDQYVAYIANVKPVEIPGEFGPLYEEYVVRRREELERELEQDHENATDNAVNDVAGKVIDADYVSEV